ncbi:MFS transporter [Sandaracinobacteroides hominis]|uniref:MFS transporter n=1 Tax=Sandaracinobacteroides hominis TaxID=2780086 RepID=UPI0018F7A1CE|nr:MFS transporter [Sandaracinobacteroides hominis]
MLITIYVFMPYYVRVVAETPVAGQALVALAGQYAGWGVALTAPLLGVIVDRLGPRKPALALTVLLMIPIYAMMWFVYPGGPIGTTLFLCMLVAKSILFAWTEVFHNALLLPAAPGQTARASGMGLAMGNAISVAVLLFVMWAFSLPGVVSWGFVPATPLFGLDQAAHEPARLAGPIVSISLAIGLALILWGVPDVTGKGEKLSSAARKGVADLKAMFSELKREREAAKFLFARMLYADGKTAILLFSGVLAAGTMGWGTLEMLAYGILMSIVAVAGGFLAAWLDPRIGPKAAVLIEIAITSMVLVALLGTRPTRIAWMPVDSTPLFDGPMFTTLPELAFIGIAAISAISITAAYASSRTLLTYLVPAERAGTFFGLYALSGTATMWLGPMLVAWGTIATQSQQGGFATVLVLLLAGFGMLLTVNAPKRA